MNPKSKKLREDLDAIITSGGPYVVIPSKQKVLDRLMDYIRTHYEELKGSHE